MESRGSQLHILLAEDSLTSRLIAMMNLEEAGHAIEVVENGHEAVQMLEEGEFDLVLMDVYMPELDGLEATRIIRRREKDSGRHVPIIAMTATETERHLEKCLAAGMDGFVSKPVSLDELHRVLEPLSCWGRGLRVYDRQEGNPPRWGGRSHSFPFTLEEGSGSPLPVDLDQALETVGGDLEILKDVMEVFASEYPEQVQVLRDACARRDAASVERAAHRLKGILANVGGLKARELAQQLEAIAEGGRLDSGVAMVEELEVEIERVVAFFSGPGWEQSALGRE
jgi:CheY-like chemotaxis protein